MGDISRYFSRREITCNCKCGFDSINSKVLDLADEVRNFVGVPLTPTSGCRCETWNREEGGGKYSQHLLGNAIDLPVSNPKEVYDHLDKKYPDSLGLGLYEEFIHIDVKPGKARRW